MTVELNDIYLVTLSEPANYCPGWEQEVINIKHFAVFRKASAYS